MKSNTLKVLVLCTGNSCRSVMAEALINNLGRGCDQAASESCPLFPGNPKKLHWSMPDPAKVTGSDANIDAAFDKVFFMLKNRIEEMLSNQDYWRAQAKIETQMCT